MFAADISDQTNMPGASRCAHAKHVGGSITGKAASNGDEQILITSVSGRITAHGQRVEGKLKRGEQNSIPITRGGGAPRIRNAGASTCENICAGVAQRPFHR